MAAGRPEVYTFELGLRVCEKIASEYKSIRKLHAENKEWFPHDDVIKNWRVKYPEFLCQYLDAKRKQAELAAESLQEYGDELFNEYSFIDEKGIKRVDSGAVSAFKLLSDNTRWSAGRLAKALYGDSSEVKVVIQDHESWLRESQAKLLAHEE